MTRRPLIQIALDYPTIQHATACARLGIEAGVDVLEIGTPLIVSEGVKTIGQLRRSFPDYPIVVDFKAMDLGAKHVRLAQTHGAQWVTVCGGAPDETIRSAVAAGRETGIKVVADLIGCRDVTGRAFECQDLGVDMLFLHYGADQRQADASRDASQWVEAVLRAVSIPVGVATFGAEDAVRAVRAGAALVAIGQPVVAADEPLVALGDYVSRVRAAVRG